MRRCRGFTLFEAMIASFLFGMVMLALASLFSDSARVTRYVDLKERTTLALQIGLERISSELREATEIKGTGSTLRFEKIDPLAEFNEGNLPGIPDPVPPGWSPGGWTRYAGGARVDVRYSVADGVLYREVQGERQKVIEGLEGFNSEQPETGVIELTVAVAEQNVIRTLSTRVVCPVIVP